ELRDTLLYAVPHRPAEKRPIRLPRLPQLRIRFERLLTILPVDRPMRAPTQRPVIRPRRVRPIQIDPLRDITGIHTWSSPQTHAARSPLPPKVFHHPFHLDGENRLNAPARVPPAVPRYGRR